MFMLSDKASFDRLGRESVLHLPSRASLALNATGTLIVQGVVDGLLTEAIAQSLSDEYALDIESAVFDSSQFLRELAELGALREDGASR